MREAEIDMASPSPARRDTAVRRYGQLEERLAVLGGYAAEAEAVSIAPASGCRTKVLGSRWPTLSGGQRRRVELARILFGGRADTCCWTSRPTTWMPTPWPGCATTCGRSAAAWW